MAFYRYIYIYNLGECAVGKPQGKCKGCEESYVVNGSKYDTSTLSCHMLKCKGIEKLKQTKLPEMMLDNLEKLRCRKIDQNVFKHKLALAIIKHDLIFFFC